MADKKTMTTQQELRAALEELARTGRAAIDDGIECTLDRMVTSSVLIRGESALEFVVALRAAERLLKKENS